MRQEAEASGHSNFHELHVNVTFARDKIVYARILIVNLQIFSTPKRFPQAPKRTTINMSGEIATVYRQCLLASRGTTG